MPLQSWHWLILQARKKGTGTIQNMLDVLTLEFRSLLIIIRNPAPNPKTTQSKRGH